MPTRLVYGVIPSFPIINADLTTQKTRTEATKIAQAEIKATVAERCIPNALSHDIPLAANWFYKAGEDALVDPETKKGWVGPLVVVQAKRRMAVVQILDRDKRQIFNSFQVKPFQQDCLFNLKPCQVYPVLI